MNNFNVEYDDFIGVFHNVYPDGYCTHIINEIERFQQNGAGSTRKQSENIDAHVKDDFQTSLIIHSPNLRPEPFIINGEAHTPVPLFFNGLQRCFDIYTEKFSILHQVELKTQDMKLQKTVPGGGYHVWHSEQGNNSENARRVLTFILYLNTIDPKDGGETEFLYQRKRYSPVENTMLIWPAAFTHAHRGNTVLGDRDKYIATGWFTLV